MTHYHVYEADSAMTTGFRVRAQAEAHAGGFKGSRIADCDLEDCARFYGLRDAAGHPSPRGPLTGKPIPCALCDGD